MSIAGDRGEHTESFTGSASESFTERRAMAQSFATLRVTLTSNEMDGDVALAVRANRARSAAPRRREYRERFIVCLMFFVFPGLA